MRRLALSLVLILSLLPAAALAQEAGGFVQIPLDVYQELMAAQGDRERAAPAGYAMGNAQVQVTVTESEGRAHADATVSVSVEILENEWVMVPILPAGTAVTSATVGGRPMQLVSTPGGMMWATNSAGTYALQVTYQVDATAFETGYSLGLPVPPAASSQLRATLPGVGLSAAVIPSTATRITESGAQTSVQATVPATTGVQISWRTAGEAGLTVSRATYTGLMDGDAVNWIAEFDVELAGDERVNLDLLAGDVALLGIQVDGGSAPIAVRNGFFAVTLQGEGAHTVVAEFQVPVQREPGPPRVVVSTPRVPVSRFELTLPGQKEVTVQPASSVSHTVTEEATVAVVHVPMTDRVTFSWLEAVPDEVEEVEVRANAVIYHTVHAEEGVLYVHAMTIFEVTRGETSQFDVALPEGIQVNSIQSISAGVSDWRVAEAPDRRLTVFLDRLVSGEFRFDVHYELLLGAGDTSAEEVMVPLLRAENVNRQRGMVALLSSRELTLEPVREASVTRVGENQLPAFVREAVTLTIAHTFRYFETSPELVVRPAVPERDQGRFDAQVDTLISLGDVTTNGAATVEVNVKSGSIEAMQLVLPLGVNFLSLSAPSLRGQEVREEGDEQFIDVEFTQEMEGQFRIEVLYERINADTDSEVPVPFLRIVGAEVEQGRIAIEALSAVEVQASTAEHLSSVEISELPQQLILRTTNPILLAFKYVQADPRPLLGLRITRHREIEVQAAIIDQANYRTLFTKDGFSVTTALFIVRNSRQQFLRVRLPAGSEVWSASVNGQSETPALGDTQEDGSLEVLINIINSAQGFPVELIYTSQSDPLGLIGQIRNELPRPDMVVTHTQWAIYLPDDLRYGTPESELNLIAEGVYVGSGDMGMETAQARNAAVVDQPIRISVPSSGLLFSFEKLYANQSQEIIGVTIPYSSERSAGLGLFMSLAGTVLFWLCLAGVFRKERKLSALWLYGGIIIGLAMLIFALVYFDAATSGPIGLSVAFIALFVIASVWRSRVLPWIRARREARAEAKAAAAKASAEAMVARAAIPSTELPTPLPVAEEPAPPAEPSGEEPDKGDES